MKGLVFTTFYDFVEQSYGADLLDDIILASGVPNDGAYTSVGTYPFQQMVALVAAAAQVTGVAMPVLLDRFGAHCFVCWVQTAPSYFEGRDLFDVLAQIDNFHESEVRKLYADAEMPSFVVEARSTARLTLRYFSCKPLADLATGVIRGASAHLLDPVAIRHEPIADPNGDYVRFTIDRIGVAA